MQNVESKSQAEQEKGLKERGGEPPQTGAMVQVSVNGKEVSIHRGHQPVQEVKRIAGVPLAHELEQIEDGQMKPLPDDGAVVIKGGEVFVSHPRTSASS